MIARIFQLAISCITMYLFQVTQGALMGAFTGTIIGGTIHSRDNYLKFIEKNQATAFQNQFEAKKQLQDKVLYLFCAYL